MDILIGLHQVIDTFWYNILLSLAGLHWTVLRGLIVMGHAVEVINDWLLDHAFAPLIAQTNASLDAAVSIAFVIALLVLGLTYLLAAFVRLEVVSFRSAVTWYIAGALFFTLGPTLYHGMNDFRASIAQGFYLSTLHGLEDTLGSSFSSLNQVTSNDLPLGPLCDYLGVYLPDAAGPDGIDGLDVAIAYLRADGPDVMGYPQPLFSPGCPPHFFHPGSGDYISAVPQEWFADGSYFDFLRSPYHFADMTDDARAASISMASSAQSRLFTAWPLVLFGVTEQIVYLLITTAMGITFISFSMAILFAFFKKTEVIARSIIEQWIELIVQTVVIAMVQSLVVAFFLAGTASGSGMVALGIGLICLVFMLIVLWSGIKAVWNSLNRLFGAMGQATGGAVIAPGAAASTAATAGAAAAGSVVGLGANALAGMTALNRSATVAQTSGIMLGGSSSLSSAARMLAYLPGVRGTSLGDAAEQFTEGAITRQVARHVPMVGRAAGPLAAPYLLTDRDPDAADYDEYGRVLSRPMLVPAVGDSLERFTVPPGARPRRPTAAAPEFIEGEEGEFLPVGEFTPVRPRRMGTFTPVGAPPEEVQAADDAGEAQRQAQSTYANDMQGEEMEQHISGVMRANMNTASPLNATLERDRQQGDLRVDQMAAQLEASADALLRAAQMQTLVGQLRVSGSQDVAGVMGDVIRQTQHDREQLGQPRHTGMDHLQAAAQVAAVMGVTPLEGGPPPVQQDLTRFGLFIDRALQLGLSPQQTEQVVQEVKASPAGALTDPTRQTLVAQVREEQNLSWHDAQQEVGQLERYAGGLPEVITAFGTVRVPAEAPPVNVAVQPNIHVTPPPAVPDSGYDDAARRESALGGSGSVIGGEGAS